MPKMTREADFRRLAHKVRQRMDWQELLEATGRAQRRAVIVNEHAYIYRSAEMAQRINQTKKEYKAALRQTVAELFRSHYARVA